MLPSPFARPLHAPLLAAALASAVIAGPVRGQSPQATPPGDVAKDLRLNPAAEERDAKRSELEALRSQRTQSTETENFLKAEIAALNEDRAALNRQLIDTAARLRTVETEIAEREKRLLPLNAREQTIRASLEARQGIIIEILAALQRAGRKPPPALLVSPDDALKSVHAAIALGALVPDMRAEADRLIADLTDLSKVRSAIAAERDRLRQDRDAMTADQQRLALLIDERQRRLKDTESALAAEKQRAAALARQAEDLKDLVAKLDQRLDLAARTAAKPPEAPAREPGRPAMPLSDPGRLAPAMAFASAKGLLPLPVNGLKIRDFGTADGLGGTEKGQTLAVRPGAQITSPCDGWVVYAGPFRSYGQLLILNAGGGYHVVLAGMEKISVDLGQFVVTGEPVATMGSATTLAAMALPAPPAGAPAGLSATSPVGSGQPVLYIEFRKDGTPVDPGPWWTVTEGEKVRG